MHQAHAVWDEISWLADLQYRDFDEVQRIGAAVMNALSLTSADAASRKAAWVQAQIEIGHAFKSGYLTPSEATRHLLLCGLQERGSAPELPPSSGPPPSDLRMIKAS